jgi:hypothetical protein
MSRVFLVSAIALLMTLGSTQSAYAANQAGGGRLVDCGTSNAPAPSGPTPDPTQAPATATPIVPGVPIISQTTLTYTEGGLTITRRTTVQEKGPSSASSGGRLASVTGACTPLGGQRIVTDQSTVCGAGCITEYLQRTLDKFSNSADPYNTYYQRAEVRLWWVRTNGDPITFGDSYTEWDEEGAFTCDGAPAGRTTANTFYPQWQYSTRSYDYYWNEYWLPIIATPGSPTIKVWNRTSTSFGISLQTLAVVE